MKKMMKKNTKKKGFTLIELIAVIAILAILGAVLVPKISGYQNKAHKSNVQTAAKTMVHAIQAYNADAVARPTPHVAGAGIQGQAAINEDTVSVVIGFVNVANGATDSTINTSGGDKSYALLKGLTVAKLCSVASGDFTYNASALTVIGSSGSIDN